MIIHIHEIKSEGHNFLFTHEDKKLKELLKELAHENPILVSGFVYPIKGGYDVSGEVTTTVPMDCSYCTNSIGIPVKEKFHEVMLLTPKSQGSQKEVDLKPDELEISYINNNQIDLSQILKEVITVNLPLQPKCVEKGAPANYPHCVADWDYEKYFNKDVDITSRNPFEALKKLKKTDS